jgi:hypothetical protein
MVGFFPIALGGIENDHTFDQYLPVFSRDFLVLNSATWWVPFKSIKLASYLLGTTRLHSSRCDLKIHMIVLSLHHGLVRLTKSILSDCVSADFGHCADLLEIMMMMIMLIIEVSTPHIKALHTTSS